MFRIASLGAVQFLALVAQPRLAQASLAEGWGAPPQHTEASINAAAADHPAPAQTSEQVTLTAGGTMQKSPMMRKETELLEEEQHQRHKKGSAKAMFDNLDLNGNGLVSSHEIKVSMQQSKFPIPQALQSLMQDVDDNAEGGISFVEFRGAAKEAEDKNALHLAETTHTIYKHHRHHATIHEHENEAKMTTKTEVTTQSAWVTCGGHKAPTCDACTKTNAAGQTVFDHGHEWCHGDCAYAGEKCYPKGSVPAGATPVTGTKKGASTSFSTTAVPDILNKQMTPMDAEIVNNAAADAIKEENVEAAEKQRKEEEAEESSKFSWGKFWLIVVITFSVILGICAIVSIVALVVFCLMGSPGPRKGEDEEGEAFVEGEGEGEGEAVDAAAQS